MIKEWNILVLQTMMNDDRLSPLRKYFIWEMLKELECTKLK